MLLSNYRLKNMGVFCVYRMQTVKPVLFFSTMQYVFAYPLSSKGLPFADLKLTRLNLQKTLKWNWTPI